MLKSIAALFESLFHFKKRTDRSKTCRNPHKYSFEDRGHEIEITTDIPVRNHKTFLRGKDVEEYCSCGDKLKTEGVVFSINGSGKTVTRPVQYCPRCDKKPVRFSTLIWIIDGKFAMR